MRQKNLWLTVGIPGSGKSYFVNNKFADLVKNSRPRIVSRDKIRYKILDATNCNDYFGKEEEVWKEYVSTIQKYLDDNETTDIIADATHLNKKSRLKLLSQLKLQEATINFIIAHTKLEICLHRNSQREGRAKVPNNTIIDMSKRFQAPRQDELMHYKTQQIILVDEKEATLIEKE